MSLQSWSETLVTAQSDGSALTNSTAATSIIPAAAKFTLPANFFSIGKMLRIHAIGRISTTASTPTMTFDVRLGSTIVYPGAALTLATLTNKTFELDIMLTCRSLGQGTSATLIGTGRYLMSGSLTLIPDTAPAVGTGFDSTAAQALDLFGTWSAASSSNSVTVHQYSLEAMN